MAHQRKFEMFQITSWSDLCQLLIKEIFKYKEIELYDHHLKIVILAKLKFN